MVAVSPFDVLNSLFFTDILRVIILGFLGFYAIFTIIIVRQVDLMSRILITPVSPIVRAFSIFHAGVAIGLDVLLYGILR